MKARYDAAGEGKELFAFVDFGINPNVKLPASSKIATWVPAGTVTVGVGNNVWAGGDNKNPYGYVVSLLERPSPSTAGPRSRRDN